MQSVMETSQRQISMFTEEELTSSRGDSPVSRTQQPEKDLARRMLDISGLRCLEQYERLPQHTSWGKMLLDYLIGAGAWSLTRSNLIWKLKGTQSNRYYFQLSPSEPLTSGTESGLLPTVTSETGRKTDFKQGGKSIWTGMKEMGLLHTPTTYEAVSRTNPRNSRGEPKLEQQARNLHMSLLPTPISGNARHGCKADSMRIKRKQEQGWTIDIQDTSIVGYPDRPKMKKDRKGEDGSKELRQSQTGTTSQQLNPQFVAEMMGFPPNWLELPFQNTETNP